MVMSCLKKLINSHTIISDVFFEKNQKIDYLVNLKNKLLKPKPMKTLIKVNIYDNKKGIKLFIKKWNDNNRFFLHQFNQQSSCT